MGQLTDKMERSSRGAVQPMGFGRSTQERVPPMLLLGLVHAAKDDEAARVKEAGLDGAVVSANGGVAGPGESLKGQTWGALVAEARPALVEGADFQVFTADTTPLAALANGKQTSLMQVAPELDDSLLRTIDDLPVDGFYVSLADAPVLTVRQLMRIGRVRGATSKWLLVGLARLPDAKELTGLRDAGVNAIVVDVAGENVGSLAACRQALLNLPREERHRNERSAAVLPRQRAGTSVRRPEPEPDDDDDDGGGDAPL